MFIIFFLFWFPLLFLFFYGLTRHPSPATRHPRKSPAVFLISTRTKTRNFGSFNQILLTLFYFLKVYYFFNSYLVFTLVLPSGFRPPEFFAVLHVRVPLGFHSSLQRSCFRRTPDLARKIIFVWLRARAHANTDVTKAFR